MFQFYNREYILAFWVIPFLIVFFILALRHKMKCLNRFGEMKTLQRLSNFSLREWQFKAFLICFGIVFAVFALMRPQWGAEKKKIQRKGVDVLFVVDTSLSMLAQDIKPSRIEKTKLEIKSFVKNLKGDRIGLIPFAGSSFLQAPLTLDYAAFFLFLDAVNVGYIPDPGSSISEALLSAIKSFPKEEKKYRVIVILSDGEFHGENLSVVLKKAVQEEVRIYAIGMGTADGEPIPLKADRGKVVGYKKDRSGQVVITKLNESFLVDITKATNGLYFPATPGEQEIDLIYKDMQKLGKRQFKEQSVTEREDHYQLFLGISLIFLILESFWTEKRKEHSKKSPRLPVEHAN